MPTTPVRRRYRRGIRRRQVIIWDEGVWTPVRTIAGIQVRTHLKFDLGVRYGRRWALVRLHGKRSSSPVAAHKGQGFRFSGSKREVASSTSCRTVLLPLRKKSAPPEIPGDPPAEPSTLRAGAEMPGSLRSHNWPRFIDDPHGEDDWLARGAVRADIGCWSGSKVRTSSYSRGTVTTGQRRSHIWFQALRGCAVCMDRW